MNKTIFQLILQGFLTLLKLLSSVLLSLFSLTLFTIIKLSKLTVKALGTGIKPTVIRNKMFIVLIENLDNRMKSFLIENIDLLQGKEAMESLFNNLKTLLRLDKEDGINK